MSRLRHVAGVLLALALLLGIAPIARAAGPIDGVDGQGVESDPFLIRDAVDLRAVAEHINAGFPEAHLRLESDVDFGGGEFSGIDRLTGSLDGAGHTISNVVYVDSETSNDLGLVRTLDAGASATSSSTDWN